MKQDHEDLKAYEPAARIFCKKAGIDPDERVQTRNPLAPLTVQFTPWWKFIATELVYLSMQLVALKQAKADEQAAADKPRILS